MAATDICIDWLKTPGIATRSVKEIEAVPKIDRWRKFVVLGFRDTASDQKIKENHDRHMINLKERYEEMKRGKKGEEKSEEGKKEEERKDVPSFGTQSTFCDKSGKRMHGSPLSVPSRVPTPKRQQMEQLHFETPSTPRNDCTTEFNGFANKQNQQKPSTAALQKIDCSREFKGFANKQQNEDSFVLDSPPIEKVATAACTNTFKGFLNKPQPQIEPQFESSESSVILISSLPNYTKKFEGFAKLQQQANSLSTPLYVETDSSKMQQQQQPCDDIKMLKLPKLKLWNTNPDKFGSFGIFNPDQPLPTRFSESSGSYSTPNCSTPNEDQLISPLPSPHSQNPKELIRDPTPNGISFEIVPPGSGCVNPTAKEKIRRHDKEPTAAGKRYLKQLDIVTNSTPHQLQTLIKFDKHRVKKWVGRFQNFRPSKDPTACRRRRYSNTNEDLASDPDLIMASEEEEKTDEERKAEETFAHMRQWMKKADWPLKDADRINFPKKGSTIIVRVVSSSGRRATVVPSEALDRVDCVAKTHLDLHSSSRIPPQFGEPALVILEQETDKIGQKEYRRGWIFDGNEKTVKVLLMDERRIVNVPRSQLFFCPETVMMVAPPLCVAASIQRELMEHEKELLLIVGCTAKCRVINDGGETLKLHLARINAEGHSLDMMFCGEECAGACYHHQKE